MKKIFSLIILSMFLLVISASYISACGYHDHHNCKVEANTIVEGKITFAENNTGIGKVDITVTCSHNGVDYTKHTKSVNFGALKGTYLVTFPQTHCIDGDQVTVLAEKGSLSGTKTGTVKDFILEKCLDIDVALVNVGIKIPTVPEFGTFMILLTALGAGGIFFVVRRK
jgi:hypothetical protein